jgi:hypothetical protein
MLFRPDAPVERDRAEPSSGINLRATKWRQAVRSEATMLVAVEEV